MNVIITCAGKSQRFYSEGYKVPKFLLSLEYNPIILDVVEMFDENDTFYFIFSNNQISKHPDIYNILDSSVKKYEVIIIDEHDKGPVFSALQCNQISDNDPVIITYCDFLLEWNYDKFKQFTVDCDMVIPSFKNFHPASYGKTKFAYTRVDKNNNLLQLREKECFTDNRVNEYANTGVYWFKSYKTFKNAGLELETKGYGNLKEGYVSLLAELILKNEGVVKITEVSKFICLGTPDDYEMYKFWQEVFLASEVDNKIEITSDINLVPMAGFGNRFASNKYNVIKPWIHLGKIPMFAKSCHTMPICKKWIFVIRAENENKLSSLKKSINNYFENSSIINITQPTSGQAASCLLAKPSLKKDNSLFISSCDYECRFSNENWLKAIDDESIDVYIWTFKIKKIIVKDPSAFAYCVIDSKSRLVEKVVEKSTISSDPGNDQAIVGSFWFRRASDFIYCAEEAIKNNLTVNGEHYVGNSINLLIQKGYKVKIFEVDKWVSYGDPFELDVYYYWEEYFYNKHMQNNDLLNTK